MTRKIAVVEQSLAAANDVCGLRPLHRQIAALTANWNITALMISGHQAGAPPRKVLLFSGHMIDAPGRRETRFPADRELIAAAAIAKTLVQINVGPGDLAICGGACGGDLLFAEASLARGSRLELYIPFDEPTFLADSVDFADANWRARFFAAKSQATLHVMADECRPLVADEDRYQRNNLWMLDSAARFGTERIDFICLWNGQGGDGPGGTQHLMEEVRRRAGRIHWLNTTQLWT